MVDVEPGLYPEDSLARRINRENVLFLGGARALLMQLAHPKVAAGVDEHSDFRSRPLPRLRRTVRLTMAIVFGDRATAMAAARSVNQAHSRVRGRGYSAMDPELLLWVHSTLVDSALLTYETFVQRLSPAERNAFYQEMKLVGELLGVPRAIFPDTIGDFERYIDGQITQGPVRVAPLARELGALVVRPKILRLPGLLFVPLEIITAGLLPPSLREQYGLAWGPAQRRAFGLAVKTLPRVVSLAPPVVRVWPLPGRNVRLKGNYWISA
ncbi:MAG TPA: oxygenase MpaB family protein [Candidatus Udaeobacter sp.]|nr:oxygenase MpaB family protein [Candidatus Udaeobacter sp.]